MLVISVYYYSVCYCCVHLGYVCYYWFDCFVFFFKQKTAYEMRISDWSSDVCSSDLLLIGRPIPGYIPAPDALDPSIRILGIFRQSLDQAVARRQLDAGAAGSRHVLMLAALLTGASTLRSEARRVGKGCVSTCRSWWSA